jgi:hypothetical protein
MAENKRQSTEEDEVYDPVLEELEKSRYESLEFEDILNREQEDQ